MRKLQREGEPVAGDGGRRAGRDGDRPAEIAPRVAQSQGRVIVAAGHLPLGDESVLDLEQVGEVGVDIECQA